MTWSTLHEACKHNTTADIIHLARQNDDAFQTDDHGSTPLHLLCLMLPNPVALQTLVQANPMAVSDRDIRGDTPIHLLCRHGDVTKELLQILVQADPHCLCVSNKHGYLPLHVACRCAPTNLDALAYLVKMNPYALLNHVKIGDLVRKKGSNLSVTPTHIIDHEAGLKSKDSVEFLQMRSDEFERDGGYPLHMGLAHGAPLEVVELLTDNNEEILALANKHGQTPLHVALSKKADDDIILFLLSLYPEAVHHADRRGNLPIHLAARFGANIRVVEWMLNRWPASVAEVDGDGLLAGDLVARHGNGSNEVVKLLAVPEYEFGI